MQAIGWPPLASTLLAHPQIALTPILWTTQVFREFGKHILPVYLKHLREDRENTTTQPLVLEWLSALWLLKTQGHTFDRVQGAKSCFSSFLSL